MSKRDRNAQILLCLNTSLCNGAKNLLWDWQVYQIAQVIKWKVQVSFP